MLRLALATLVAVALWLPPWWAAGRLSDLRASPFLRLLVAAGGAVVGWVGVINLLGRQTQSSLSVASVWIALNVTASAWLLWRRRDQLSVDGLRATWRTWLPVVLLAVAVGTPQWLMAVSTPYWDEVASSAIHLTAPNQFADGVFPPRHNSFPDVPLKYHYAVTMLAGTVIWLTGLSAGVSVDVVSTAIHLFVFMFVFLWFAQIGFRRLACFWGAFTVLLGGGLAWLYVPWLQTHDGFPKQGSAATLVHQYDATKGWWDNLREACGIAAFHLKNLDGSNSNLPWDIVNQFQQHAVALGLALSIFAAWLFCAWLARDRFAPGLLAANVFTFAVLPLSHAVFGSVTCVTAGLLLLGRWLFRPTRRHFLEAIGFTAGVAALALAHGGIFSRGDVYGTSFVVLTLRHGFGYSLGGVIGFVNWNLAGFGVPLLLAVWALVRWARYHRVVAQPRWLAFAFFAVMFVVSYLPPQLFYYSYGGRSVEEYTEIAKFFFVAHLALAMLSAFAIALTARPVPWWLAPPALAAMAIVPLFNVYEASFTKQNDWVGVYESPYPLPQYAEVVKMGRTLGGLKSKGDVYFDTAWGEEYRAGYLDELQVFGGAVFGLIPRRFEHTGSFLIDRTVVAERARLHSRMARLRPGAEAESGTRWYYARPDVDLSRLPVIVRSRFDKLVAEGAFVEAARANPLVLYRISGSTAKADDGIERWWRPRAVVPPRPMKNPAGRDELAFYDRRRQRVLIGERQLPLPPWLADDYAHVLVGRFGGGIDVVAARMADTHYWRGLQLADLVDYRAWFWSLHQSTTGTWSSEARQWLWDHDVPLVTDLGSEGIEEIVAFRHTTGEWFRGEQRLAGAITGPPRHHAVPVIGRFLARDRVALGVFDAVSGNWSLVPVGGDPARPAVAFQFGAPGDVVVAGDYDGDGIDDIVVWRRSNATWYRRDPATGQATAWTFGSPTGIPLPADYNHDGRLDLAYWEPAAREIRISFTQGRTVDRVIPVPPDSIPVFVNMY